MYIILCIRRSI